MAHDGLGETVGRCLRVFYADYGMDGPRDPEWLQHAMNVLVGLFIRYGLTANVTKSRTITCQPGALRAGILEKAVVLKYMGVGDSYQVRLRRQIPCLKCGFELMTGSMMSHRRRMHRTETSIDWSCLPVSQM